MSKTEEDIRAALIIAFEEKLHAAMPALRESSIISQPVQVFSNAWAPVVMGSLAPHDTIRWFSIPGLRLRVHEYGIAVNGRLITWHSRATGGGFYRYTRASELLSNEELHKALAALP